MLYRLFMQANLLRVFSTALPSEVNHSIKFLIAIQDNGIFLHTKKHNSRAVDHYRAWNSAISERWTATARGNSQFLSGGALPRVGFCIFWGLDCYHAWKFAIPECWTATTREILRFLGDGPFPRVRTRYSWAMDPSRA